MAANLKEIQIPPTATGWFWWHKLALDSAVRHISIRIRPLDLGEYMLSEKLLVDISVEPSPVKTNHRQAKSAISTAHSTGTVSLHPFALSSGPRHCLTAFSY
jgi:hypothetical protein